MYGLALCFLMLVFFSSVKLAMYHPSDIDFSGTKVWQQDSSNSQTQQIEAQQQAVVPLLDLLLLFLSLVISSRLIPQGRRASILARQQWFCPSLFLRPPPVA